MATIGTFTKTSDGVLTGAIHTLSLNLKAVQFRPMDKGDGKGPDYRVVCGAAELGAAWKEISKSKREYLSVKLDDPSLPRVIFAALFDSEDGYDLIWSRPRRRPARSGGARRTTH